MQLDFMLKTDIYRKDGSEKGARQVSLDYMVKMESFDSMKATLKIEFKNPLQVSIN